jgi:hypothetical protein
MATAVPSGAAQKGRWPLLINPLYNQNPRHGHKKRKKLTGKEGKESESVQDNMSFFIVLTHKSSNPLIHANMS